MFSEWSFISSYCLLEWYSFIVWKEFLNQIIHNLYRNDRHEHGNDHNPELWGSNEPFLLYNSTFIMRSYFMKFCMWIDHQNDPLFYQFDQLRSYDRSSNDQCEYLNDYELLIRCKVYGSNDPFCDWNNKMIKPNDPILNWSKIS